MVFQKKHKDEWQLFINEKGKIFKLLFYLLLLYHILLVGYVIGYLVLSFSLINILTAFFLVIVWSLLWVLLVEFNKQYYILLLFFVFPTILLAVSVFSYMITLVYLSGSLIKLPPYLAFIMISLIMGLVFAYLFDRGFHNPRQLITAGILSSIVFSLVFGISFYQMHSLENQIQSILLIPSSTEINSSVDGGGLNYSPKNEESNYFIYYVAIALVAYNLPYMMYYLRDNKHKKKSLLGYIIPVIIFVFIKLLIA